MAVPSEIPRAAGPRSYEFGEFRLEPSTRRLLQDGTPVHMTPRAFDLLLTLLENHHRVMSKDELLRRVWSDAIVEESNLTQHVFVLRKLLGDSQDSPRFIATIARRGYRFVGEIRESGPSAVIVNRFPAAVAERPRWRRRAALAALVAAALLGGASLARVTSRAPGPPTFRPLTFRDRGIGRARFTPDGQSIVLDARWDGEAHQLFVTPTSEPALRPLGLSQAQVVRVSATGDVAVLLDAGPAGGSLTLAKVPLSGGGPRRILEGVQNADWAPEIDEFAVLRRSQGRTRVEYPAGKLLYETPAWLEALKISPGRDQIAFLEHPTLNDTHGFVTVVDRQGQRRLRSRDWAAVFGLVWRTPGEIWFGKFDGRAHAVAAIDLAGRERDVYHGPDGLMIQDLDRAGRALAVRFTYRGEVRWRPPASVSERKLAPFNVTRPSALTDDGNGLLYTVEDPDSAWTSYAAYWQTADGSAPVRLGEGSAQGLSPDSRVALAISLRQPEHLLLLPIGAGQTRELAAGPVEHFHRAQWLPDGERVVFDGNERGKGVRLYVQAVAGGVPSAISPEGYSLDPDGVSADGRFVVCVPETGLPALCPLGTGPIEPLRGVERGDKVVRWSSDGRSVYVYKRASTPLVVFEVETRTGRRAAWKQIAPPETEHLRSVPRLLMTADGGAYAYGYVEQTSDLYLVEGLR